MIKTNWLKISKELITKVKKLDMLRNTIKVRPKNFLMIRRESIVSQNIPYSPKALFLETIEKVQ